MTEKTALVTGSGRNIGRAIALHLAKAGFNLVINGSTHREPCLEVARECQELGAETLVEMCDIGDHEQTKAMATRVTDRFGAVDVLVNNAAIRPGGDYLSITDDAWQRVMDVNFNSVLTLTRAFLPGMVERQWGRIINFTGMFAQQGFPGKSAAVTASKHALWGLTKSLSQEFGPKGITTNIISPGTIPDASEDTSQPPYPALLRRNPSGRLGTADDIAAMVDLLVSEHGGFINGQMLQINGGVVNQF